MPTEDQRIEELTRRTVGDVSALARHTADLAGARLAEAGRRALWPLMVTALGGALCVVGGAAVLLSPAVPEGGRMRRLGLGYLGLGAMGTVSGIAMLASGAVVAVHRTRQVLDAAAEGVREART